MPPDPPDRPVLDPDAIAGHGFTRARKGYEVDEVRAYLVGLASQLREAEQRRADMERRLAELERRAIDPRELDQATVTELLGEETGRVLETARQAAADIRTRAEEQATATTTAADEAAASTRRAADQYADGTRAAADEQVAQVRAEADAYAERVRAAADSETAEQRASAESVLAERTAEAETAAAAIRAEAEAYRDRVHEEADRYAESTRSAADAYRAEAHHAADTYREAATTEADQLRADATAAADTLRADAEAAAEDRRAAVEVEAEVALAAAREQGRTMVQEARTYRERVIADLGDRRRAARAQLERLAATRDALAVTLTDVAGRIEASHRALQEAPIDPTEVGEQAQDRRALETDEPDPPSEPADDASATAVAVGEVDPAPPAADGGASEVEATSGDDAEQDDAEQDEAVIETDPVIDLTAGPEDETPSEADDPEPDDPEAVATGSADPDPDPEPASPDEDAVEDLFARIRAAAEPSGDEPSGDEPSGDEPSGGPVNDDPTADPSAAAATGGAAVLAVAEAEPGDLTADADADVAPEPSTDPAVDPATGPAVASDEVSDDEPAASSEEADLLDRRDATTDELERQLSRRLKRLLSDEQNEVLDLLRRSRGTPSADAVLPTEADHLARYTSAALEDLVGAERAGAGFYGSAPRRTADVTDVATEFASQLVRQIRNRLEPAFAEGGDENEMGERIRACYREWKTQRIAEVARHYVIAAFDRGVSGAAADGTEFRWLVDHGGDAAPDCEDNALAGPTPLGTPFPTGDLAPPAHAGCRCLTVPVTT